VATYRLTVEYDGTRFHGWQEQQNARSIAGEIKRAIRELAPLVEFGGAGRTDAGVHALAQCAHLRLGRSVEPERFRGELNELLPSDIHVLSLVPVGNSFHARHSAVSRSYLYQISRRRTAFAKRFVWWVKRPLRTDLMASAASLLPGRHDFALFSERPQDQPSTEVVLESAQVEDFGSLVVIRLVASHFLWKMARRIVGVLVRIGAGEMSAAELKKLLEPSNPDAVLAGRPAEWTAPPSGLFLERIAYEGDPPLPPLRPAVPVEEEAEAGRRTP